MSEKERGRSDNGDGDGSGSDILRRRVAWFETAQVARVRERAKAREWKSQRKESRGHSVVCSAEEQFALSMRGQRNCFVACDTFEYPGKEATRCQYQNIECDGPRNVAVPGTQ